MPLQDCNSLWSSKLQIVSQPFGARRIFDAVVNGAHKICNMMVDEVKWRTLKSCAVFSKVQMH